MIQIDHIIFIVDDDSRIRESLQELLASAGLNAVAFGSAAAYLDCVKPDLPACVLLDIELPDISGLDLQQQLAQSEHPPIVFLTGHGDIPSSVRAIKGGAVDFLTKPFSEKQLLQSVQVAIDQHRRIRADQSELNLLRKRLASLTPREREVLPLVASGLLNKQAASHLGISEVTLQIHRSKIMQKMAADSLADLVRMAGRLDIPMTLTRHS